MLFLLLNVASRQRLAQLGKQPVHPISSHSAGDPAVGRFILPDGQHQELIGACQLLISREEQRWEEASE